MIQIVKQTTARPSHRRATNMCVKSGRTETIDHVGLHVVYMHAKWQVDEHIIEFRVDVVYVNVIAW